MYDSLYPSNSSSQSAAMQGIATLRCESAIGPIQSECDVQQGDTACNPRRGALKNGNPPGDPSTAQRCGARTRSGGVCQAPAMVNPRTGKRLRCRLHGGASSGPRTPEGRERCAQANYRHGRCTKQAKAEARATRAELQYLKAEIRLMDAMVRRWLRERRRANKVQPVQHIVAVLAPSRA